MRRKLWGEILCFVSTVSLSLIINYKFVQPPLHFIIGFFMFVLRHGRPGVRLVVSNFVCFNRPTVLLLRWDDKTGVVWLNKKLDKPVGSVFVLKVSFLYKVNAW
jgi:hypothetical protein